MITKEKFINAVKTLNEQDEGKGPLLSFTFSGELMGTTYTPFENNSFNYDEYWEMCMDEFLDILNKE